MKKAIGKRITKRFDDKREGMVYVVVFLWVLMGILTAYYQTDFEHTAVYYLSLTALVSSYIWGESVRKSENTSIFFKGKSSGREVLMYIVILLWLVLGTFGIVTDSDLLSISAYFAALSPFVSAYILGQTYKPIDPASLRPQLNGEYRSYEPSQQQGDENYSPDSDPQVQQALDAKKKDPSLPEPDVQEEDMST
jgi:hypothetical protein